MKPEVKILSKISIIGEELRQNLNELRDTIEHTDEFEVRFDDELDNDPKMIELAEGFGELKDDIKAMVLQMNLFLAQDYASYPAEERKHLGRREKNVFKFTQEELGKSIHQASKALFEMEQAVYEDRDFEAFTDAFHDFQDIASDARRAAGYLHEGFDFGVKEDENAFAMA